MKRAVLTLIPVAFTALALPQAAAAQRPGEMTLYSDIRYGGRSYTVTGPRGVVAVPWTVRSIRVAPGETWEVCERTEYRGCTRIDQSIASIRQNVASARPDRPDRPGPPPRPEPPVGGGSGSLRGMSAEFFPAPADRRGRVESCSQGTASCAAEAADRFCRSEGWTASSYETQQTVRGRNYLADVLCTRTRR